MAKNTQTGSLPDEDPTPAQGPSPPQPAPAPAPPPPPLSPAYFVMTDDFDGRRKGAVVKNEGDMAECIAGKCRPATKIDLGIAGVMTTEGN